MKNSPIAMPTMIRRNFKDYLLLLNATQLIFRLNQRLLKLGIMAGDEQFFANLDWNSLGLTAAELARLRNPDWRSVDQSWQWAEKSGQQIIAINDPEYPPLLREIGDPPLLLFVQGAVGELAALQLAMVGSRYPTPIGEETATDFAQQLSRGGWVITSGLAIGIDAASHRGALAGSGVTIAVMGTGLNQIYPRGNRRLAEEILVQGGVLVSEFGLEERAVAWHFPLRNRIISGLSLGTLVVEANVRSGSLITARLAGEQGREIFAIPGSIYNPVARGTNQLIRQGAKLVEHPAEVVAEFPAIILQGLQSGIGAQTSGWDWSKSNKEREKLDWQQKKLLDCVGFEVTTVDALAKRANMTVAEVMQGVLTLELAGWIERYREGYIRLQ